MKSPRDRTGKELELIVKNFLILIDALDEINLDYFVDSGTLLGMYRDNNLIKWDWDIELSVTENEFNKNESAILKVIKKINFDICKIDKINKKIDMTKDLDKSINKFSIKVWKFNEKKNIYFRNNFEIPGKFFNQISSLKCFERNFKTPNNIEEYLTYMYGDWKTPKRTSEKSEYLAIRS